MAAPIPIEVPTNLLEYRQWLWEKRSYDFAKGKREYETIRSALIQTASGSQIWASLKKVFIDAADAYYVKTGLQLFQNNDVGPPTLYGKSYDSFLEKSFRYQFIKPETRVADPSKAELPSAFYPKFDDIVRTLVVVKYLDGVEFLVRKMNAACANAAISTTVEYKSNEEGYFAAHYYFLLPVNVALADSTFDHHMKVELQVTTQLQEVLRQFLHFQYEKDRTSMKATDIPWQWRYRENEFFSNYLGHMLRNVEGQIMDARRRRSIADACAE